MQELITITTGGQGSPVVSARELYKFLEVKKQFADWIKARIEKYGFVEHRDYETFSLIGEKGRPTIEYALTLNMAKELSMVEGNERGKEARQFFIDRDDQLRQIANAPLSTEQALIQLVSQQTQLLTDAQQVLAQLRNDVDQIMHNQKRPSRMIPGKQLNVPGLPKPRPSVGTSALRQLIHTRVIEYCSYHDATTQETYNYLYKRLFDVYSINVYRLGRMGNENLLDAVERYGHLDRLYSLVMAELNYTEE